MKPTETHVSPSRQERITQYNSRIEQMESRPYYSPSAARRVDYHANELRTRIVNIGGRAI